MGSQSTPQGRTPRTQIQRGFRGPRAADDIELGRCGSGIDPDNVGDIAEEGPWPPRKVDRQEGDGVACVRRSRRAESLKERQ